MPARPRKTAAAPAARKLSTVGPTEEVFDLGAVVGGAAFKFRHIDGSEFEFCDLGDIDINVVSIADRGDLEGIKLAMRYGLGDSPDDDDRDLDEEARARWLKFSGLKLTIRTGTALFEKWAAHSGLKLGE